MRKRFDILKKSLVIVFVFCMLDMNIVTGILPDNNGIETEEMVQQPYHFGNTWYLGSSTAGGGVSFGRSYNHEFFFYNFTIMSNSTDSVVFEFTGDYVYTPALGNMILAPGESFGGNFTFIGEYATSGGTLFIEFEIGLETNGNATVIFDGIVWDTYVYKMGLTGYIILGSLGGAFILFIVFYLFFYNKGGKSPKL